MKKSGTVKNDTIKKDGMNTILDQLRRLHMEQTVNGQQGQDGEPEAGVCQTEDAGEQKPKLNGIYRCRACGYIFDESIEGKPFSTLKECPLCHVSPGGFMKLR